jgi:DNA repair protein RecO (recombination protein O)
MRGEGLSTPAVVLSVRPLGEADLLVVLLTAASGKIRAAAASARRSRRRFAGGLSGGAVGQAALVPRSRGLWRLESFQTTLEHASLGRDLHRFAYVAYLCELTDALVMEPEPDAERYEALAEAIAATIAAPADPAVLRAYELRLLSSLGLLPALSSCAACGREVPADPDAPEVALDERRGGVLCPEHAAGARAVPTDLVKLGVLLADRDASDATARFAAASPAVRRALRDLLQTCIRPHLRRPLRSLDFFAKLGTKG